MEGIAEDSVRFAHYGPSHNLLRPAFAELVSCGPLPLPVSGGGHASALPSILPVAFSRLYSLGSILPLPSSRLLPPATVLRYRPPIPSSHLHPPTLSSKHATSHHFALVLFNIHTLFSYMLMQPETLKSQIHFRDNYEVFKT